MVTITEQPVDFLLSGDPMIFNVQSDQFVQTPGVKWRTEITFDRPAEEGDSIEIEMVNFLGGIVGWECEEGDNFNFEPGDPSIEWLENGVIPKLMHLSGINQNYNIFREGLILVIEAKDFGAQYNMSFGDTSDTPLATISTTVGVDPVVRDPFFIRARIHLEDTYDEGLFIKSEWFLFKTDETGNLVKDLSEKVHEMFHELDSYSGEEMAFTVAEKSARKVRFEFSEYYEDPFWNNDPTGPNSIFTDYKTVCKGSLGKVNTLGDFEAQFVTGAKFLTNMKSGQFIHQRAPQYLSFILDFPDALIDLSSIVVQAKITYEDLTTEDEVLEVINNPVNGRVYTFPCGFYQRLLQNLQPSRVPYKYSIKVSSTPFGVDAIGEFEFMLRPESVYGNFVAFHNAFGMFEVASFDGGHLFSESVLKSSAKKARAIGSGIRDTDSHVYGVKRRPQVEIATGAIGRGHEEQLRDLITSKKHWLQIHGADSPVLVAATLLTDGIQTVGRGKSGNQTSNATLAFELNETIGNDPLNANG